MPPRPSLCGPATAGRVALRPAFVGTCAEFPPLIPDGRRKGKTAVLDTAHANRTVWLAARAYHEGLIDKAGLDMFIKTFKKQIWKPEKNPFYFANFVDGNDIA